jgi:exodeoxyribonuclease VII large subunit
LILGGLNNLDKVTVSQLCQQIEFTINQGFSGSVTLIAELSNFGNAEARAYQRKGHLYFELVELNNGKKFSISGTIWNGSKQKIYTKCETAGIKLKDGDKVAVHGKVNFYAPSSSISFTIFDIDPSVTLGEKERLKKETITRLKKEGLFDLQKKLRIPFIPLKIALITADNSSAYNDFMNRFNDNRYAFKITLFPATMQGDKTEETVVSALKKANGIQPDIIVLTRGGGASVHLSDFDNYNIAKIIAGNSIPVLTAIGHTENISVSDMVSNSFYKTPSAVAEFIYNIVKNFYNEIQGLKVQLRSSVERYLLDMTNRFKLNHQKVISVGQGFVRGEKNNILMKAREMKSGVLQYLKDRVSKINQNRKLVKLLEPENVLKRGFTLITNEDNKIISSVTDIKEGMKIHTKMKDGSFLSKVEKIKL